MHFDKYETNQTKLLCIDVHENNMPVNLSNLYNQ